MVVRSFPVQLLRKDSSKASAHIWMTRRSEAGVMEIVGGGFIPVFSCAWTVPVGLRFCCFYAAEEEKKHTKKGLYKSHHSLIFNEIKRLLIF